jgi:hypothetical protein
MKRWEVLFGVLFLLACESFADMARKIRRACFL